jgi:putative NADPH-quinone reductase
MTVLIIVAHPNRASFNHAIAAACCETLRANGHNVTYHDLYEERFDPVLPFSEFSREATLSEEIALHCNELSQADGIVIVHSNWWGQPPAILKGWIDRVVRPGVAYEFKEGDKGEGVPHGLLKAKAALVFNTSNTETSRETGVFGDPLETLWKNCIFDLCGVTNFNRRMFSVVVTSSEAERREWLSEVKATTERLFRKNTSSR